MSTPTGQETARVVRDGVPVGSLTRTDRGAVFEYDAAFFDQHRDLPGGIAVHLPYRQRRFEVAGTNLHPYFAGLLPEGYRLRALVRSLKTSEDDLFSLLLASGNDTVGDLSLESPGSKADPDASDDEPWRPEEVSFSALLRQSLSRMKTGFEPNVPGVQEKLSASTISLPLRPVGRTAYILKLNPPDKPRLVENEAFFMKVARECELETATTRLVHDRAGAAGLLVERFDRVWDKGEKRLRRIHQEDACQLLDRYPADKYRLSLREVATGVADVVTAPVPDMLRLLQLVAFSYAIANGDLHAKNVSVLATGSPNALRLSPAYDLLTTLPYGDQRMALKLEGRDGNLRRKHFVELGARFGVSHRALDRMLDRLIEKLTPFVAHLEEIGFNSKQTKFLETTVRERLVHLSE